MAGITDDGLDRETLARRDAADPLAGLRSEFELPDGVIYLDGNSLGALPKAAPDRVADVVHRQWGKHLIGGWNGDGWLEAPLRIGAKIAPLIGARSDEVVVGDSTSINLFKLAVGAMGLRPGRTTILTEPGNFPTDLYMLQGVEALLSGRARLVVRDRQDLPGAIDDSVAAVVLTHVHYKTAERWPLAQITGLAHEKGALTIWDLSHSVGALAVDLNRAGADLAVGCGYKYLNGGPGAPSFVFVAERWQAALRSPLSGWMGHADPFAFGDDYQPAPGIRRQLCGTPGILGLAALEAGVDMFASLEMSAVEAKGLALAETFIKLVERRCGFPDLELASPRDTAGRGCHVSFSHPRGYAVVQALIARGVIDDFRAPDLMRFGFAPLYLRFVDVWDAVEALRQVLESGEWDQPQFHRRAAVT